MADSGCRPARVLIEFQECEKMKLTAYINSSALFNLIGSQCAQPTGRPAGRAKVALDLCSPLTTGTRRAPGTKLKLFACDICMSQAGQSAPYKLRPPLDRSINLCVSRADLTGARQRRAPPTLARLECHQQTQFVSAGAALCVPFDLIARVKVTSARTGRRAEERRSLVSAQVADIQSDSRFVRANLHSVSGPPTARP